MARGWQWDRAHRIAPALEAVTGHGSRDYAGPLNFWETMPRGFDKTTGLGRVANWVLAYSRRALTVVAAAADEDQAFLLTDAMKKEAALNPWLSQRLEFIRKQVKGPGGSLQVITSDAPTAAGGRPDIVLVDEVTHWKRRDLWDMLFSGRDKRWNALFFVITNAGLLGSWQHDLLKAARQSPLWRVYEAPEGRSLPTWMSEVQIAENRKMLLPSEARRLLDNVWIDPAEESGYLTRADAEACEALGREMALVCQPAGKKGVEYWAGIDYGPKRDRTVLSILHQEGGGVLAVDRLDVWQGSPVTPIQIRAVYEWIEQYRKAFHDLHLVVDPYQLEDLVQHYERHLHIQRFEARGGKSNYELAECLRSLIVNRQIAWYPGAGVLPMPDGTQESLTDELVGLVIKRTVYGYRIDHEVTRHDDRAVAIGMPAVTLLSRPRPAPFQRPPVLEKPVEFEPLRPRTSGWLGVYGMK
jgi:hypothetical protein